MGIETFTVFAAVNKERREICLGATQRPIFKLIADIRARKAKPCGWGPKETLHIRSLEFGLSRSEARAFIRRRLEATPARGWRYVGGSARSTSA